MDIEVHDQHLIAAPLVQAGLRSNHQIVEQTKTAAVSPVGVVIAAGYLQSAALFEGVAAGGQGSPDREQGALDEPWRPGKTELADGVIVKLACKCGTHIVTVVNPVDLRSGCGLCLLEWIAPGAERLKQGLVFCQGKAMAFGQRQRGVIRVMEDAQ